MATLVTRWPRGEGVTKGRSRCDHCGQAIAARDLIPLLSAVLLKGKCRHCGVPIDPAHIAIEGLCALVGSTALLVSPGQAGFLGALFGWLLVALAALDLRHFWLPDRLTLSVALIGVGGGLIDVYPALADRLIGGAVGFLGLLVVALGYRLIRKREGMGGGDPKLFGAIGLVLGWQALPFVLLGASGVGVFFAIARIPPRRKFLASDRLPLGTFLALAAFLAWIGMQP